MTARSLLVAGLALGSAVVAGNAPAALAAGCADGSTAADLSALFDAGIGPITGADYQRAFTLDDGRVLWVFQDAYVGTADGRTVLVHNAGAIEVDGCFTALVGGTPTAPQAWLAPADTTPFEHWYWPLGGMRLDADTYRVYLAEMEEHGVDYLEAATPVATATVDVDLTALAPSRVQPAADASASLYGWSIVADDDYHYLYGYCYRQFGASIIGHDTCSSELRVARQPIGRPDDPLAYWDGASWVDDPGAAADIAPKFGPFGEPRTINPMQIGRAPDGRYIAVTKEGDWWGSAVYLDAAPAPQGPWTTTAVLPTAWPNASGETNSYFASLVPSTGDEQLVAVSHNCWTQPGCDAYRPSVHAIPNALWRPREAVAITGRAALPLGPAIGEAS